MEGKLGHVGKWQEVDRSDKVSSVQWFSGFVVDAQQYKENGHTRDRAGDAILRAPAASSVKKEKFFGMLHECLGIQNCCYCSRLPLKSTAL